MRVIALIIFTLMSAVPALAQVYHGRSAAIPADHGARPAYAPAYAWGWGYNRFTYGPNCLRYGYPPNCAYWELPDWNGGMEIRNPGGG
jgi:hypothetical protein